MAGAVSKKTWIRGLGSRTGDGEIQIASMPIRGWIRRARCSAAGGGNVTLSVGETSAGTGFATVLAYGPTATPLDQEEDPGIFYEIPASATAGSTGTLFVDVTGAGLINIFLDIEPAK